MSRFLDLLPRPRRLSGRGFVTLVHASTDESSSAAGLTGVWQVAGALGETLARIVVVGRGGTSEEDEGAVVRFVTAPGGRLDGVALERELARRPADASRVVVLTDPALEAWAEPARTLADGYAARVVDELGGRALLWDELGETEAHPRPGLLVVARSRLGERIDAALGDLRCFDLRALRRLRDLEVPAHRVPVALGSALGPLRRASALLDGAAPRLEIDRRSLPGAVEEGSEAVVEVDGWILSLPPVDGLALRCGPLAAPVAVDVDRPDVAASQPQLPSVTCGFRGRLATATLPSGRHAVTLERRDGRVLRELGTIVVGRAGESPAKRGRRGGEPGLLSVDRCAVEPSGGEPPWRLRIEGRVARPGSVDAVRVTVGGSRLLDVDPRSFGNEEGGSAEFRLDEAFAVGEGAVEIGVSALRGQEALASWRVEVDVPAVSPGRVRLRSDDLDRLRRAPDAPVWGGVCVRGRVEAAPSEAEVVLRAGGREGDRAPLAADGSFEVAVALEAGRDETIDLAVEHRGVALAAAGPLAVRVRGVHVTESTSRDLDAVRQALGGHGDRFGAASSRELLDELALRSPETWPDIVAALGRLGERIRAARLRPSRIAPIDRPKADGPPLRVLWVSSEVPWSGHGGGVTQVAWLRELGGRHEITLAHPVHPGAEGLSEEVRPSVREILTVTRDWRVASGPAPFGVPEAQLRTYTPALRAAIHAEATSGRHDLVQYEFSGCFFYSTAGPVPDLLVLHEVESFGLAAGRAPLRSDAVSPSRRLGDLIARLHFETVLAPRRFGALATVSEPEARFLLPFLPDSTLRVSPLPVEIDRPRRSAGRSGTVEEPTFVFVGNYRHPPNGVAAFELVEETWPELRRRVPGARLVLAGADAPLELVERARAGGVDCRGWVEDLDRLLAGATALVAPIRTGAGMRVKLLEAMACGCPVVTTALGANGLGAIDGESYLKAESTAELAAAAARLAFDPALRERLSAAARVFVEKEHGPAIQAARREAIWRAVLEERAGGPGA